MATADDLARGRDSFDRQAWGDAFAQLSAADRAPGSGPISGGSNSPSSATPDSRYTNVAS